MCQHPVPLSELLIGYEEKYAIGEDRQASVRQGRSRSSLGLRGVGPRPTRRNKKSAARRGRAALLLKLALDAPLYGGEDVRMSESEQE